MSLSSPGGLWFLGLVPLLILMYILKQRYEEREVSSLYLWQQVLMDTEVTSPFQKLKRNILFFLQLLILLLCIFALTNPFVWLGKKSFENVVLILDTSGSMSSLEDGETKLETAKKKGEGIINSLVTGSKMTLISSGKSSTIEISGTTNKKEIIRKLKEIEATNSAGNIDDVYSLIKAICNQYKSYRVIYLSDRGVDLKNLNGEDVVIGTPRNNVSLDYISQSKGLNGLKVLLRVTNHSGENTKAEICLYADEKLISIKAETINQEETKTIYFDNIPENVKYIYGEISQKDGLLEDNKIYSIVKQREAKKVLLSTEKNVFLEKALSVLKDIELYKTLPGEKIKDDFDLYIYDGEVKGKLPQKGNILFINPQQSNSFFKVGGDLQGGKAEVVIHSITKYLSNSDFVISKLSAIDEPYWTSPLLTVMNKTAAFVGELKGQKVAALGFDLHDTDLPLTPEFPIFINNLISYLIDRDTLTNTQYNCGDSIEILPLPETEKIFVTDPKEKKVELDSKFPVNPFEKTSMPGVYKITQRLAGKELTRFVAVNFPTSESNINKADNLYKKSNNTTNTGHQGGINLLYMLLIVALIILIFEWIIYVRSGYGIKL